MPVVYACTSVCHLDSFYLYLYRHFPFNEPLCRLRGYRLFKPRNIAVVLKVANLVTAILAIIGTKAFGKDSKSLIISLLDRYSHWARWGIGVFVIFGLITILIICNIVFHISATPSA